MNKRKIFNDPVYGFISLPYDSTFDLVEHPYFQRLRRIKQLGLSDYVYPGAHHTRFHHALGALHLTVEALATLRAKGISITEEEEEAVCIAILLHDIGHAPFSHALEYMFTDLHHEKVSQLYFDELAQEFTHPLTMASQIYSDTYPKRFLHQLVSSQLDMDRMDYLNRDSFFTGVAEGIIGYDRIIKMLMVVDDNLVIEEKGLLSIENFLMARRMMYWQVYLHKTVIAAEQMLRKFLSILKTEEIITPNPTLNMLWYKNNTDNEFIVNFASLDDYDIITLLKLYNRGKNPYLSLLAQGLLHRKLFKTRFKNEPFTPEEIHQLAQEVSTKYGQETARELVLTGSESNMHYAGGANEIGILQKNGQVCPLSQLTDFPAENRISTKYFCCFPV